MSEAATKPSDQSPGQGTEVPDDIDIHTTAGKVADLARRLEAAVHAGSERAIEKQHAKGKKTARERVLELLDEDSFVELDELARHRSTAFGLGEEPALRRRRRHRVRHHRRPPGLRVSRRTSRSFGGSLGQVSAEKIVKVMDLAMKTGCPIIGINDSGGARIQEGVVSLGLYARSSAATCTRSGVIPQISLIMGPCAGGAVYSPAVTDFTVMVDQTSHMFITGPDVIKTVTGEGRVDGGPRWCPVAPPSRGTRTTWAATSPTRSDYVKALVSYLPQTNLDEPFSYQETADLEVTDEDAGAGHADPDSPNQPYDMHTVIESIVDDGESSRCRPCSPPTC